MLIPAARTVLLRVCAVNLHLICLGPTRRLPLAEVKPPPTMLSPRFCRVPPRVFLVSGRGRSLTPPARRETICRGEAIYPGRTPVHNAALVIITHRPLTAYCPTLYQPLFGSPRCSLAFPLNGTLLYCCACLQTQGLWNFLLQPHSRGPDQRSESELE